MPFIIVSLLVGVVVTFIASDQAARKAATDLQSVAVREEDAVAAAFAETVQRQLTEERALAGTEGVATLVRLRDRAGVERSLYPIVANALPNRLRVSIVKLDGTELSRLTPAAENAATCDCSTGRDLSGWPHVRDVLHGVGDGLGNKYSAVTRDSDGEVLYSVGPLLDGGRIVGAVIVSERLTDVTRTIARISGLDIALFDPAGHLLAAVPGFPLADATLEPPQRAAALDVSRQTAVYRVLPHSSRAGFFVPWTVRRVVDGYVCVLVPAEAVTAATQSLPDTLVLIFLAALVVSLLAAYYVSTRVARPLAALLRATEEVARGNLAHRARIYSSDEIGRVTAAFNHMTESLARQRDQLEASTESTMLTLAATIDARDPYTHGHSVRVAGYSREIGREMGLSAAELEVISRGCLVHDIGKIGIPDSILRKRGPLAGAELTRMRQHPETGYRLLQHLPWEPEVLDITRHHHERWDGRGYPAGLAGNQIPAVARLVAVADTLDAMTSDRPYRQAFSMEYAVEEIRRGAGSQFDPAVVDAFLRAQPGIGVSAAAQAWSVPDVTPVAVPVAMEPAS